MNDSAPSSYPKKLQEAPTPVQVEKHACEPRILTFSKQQKHTGPSPLMFSEGHVQINKKRSPEYMLLYQI